MRKALLILSASFSLFIFSCQKELANDLGGANGTGTGSTGTTAGKLVGTWKFVNLHAKTFSSNESTLAGITQRTETTSDYNSINNVGTIVFTAQTMASNNVGYEVDSWAFNKVFMNGVLSDTFTMPLQIAFPLTSSSANYTVITADSIYIQGGAGTTPGGAKVRFSNDTLYMTQRIDEAGVQVVSGVSFKTVRKADVVTALKKQ